MNFYKKISLFLWLALWTAIAAPQVSAQCYRQLFDASGFNTDPYQGSLGEAACALRETLPTEFKDKFKVFSCGFYVLQQNFKEFGYPEAFTLAEQQVAAQSPYYLLFGRQSDPTGIYTRFYVALKLPSTGVFRCLKENEKQFITNQIQSIAAANYEGNDNAAVQYYKAEIACMQALQRYIEKIASCCAQSLVEQNCSYCGDLEFLSQLQDKLDGMCFVQFPIVIDQADTRRDRPTLTDPNSKQATESLNNLVDILSDAKIRFRDEDPAGALGGVMATLLNDQYFSHIAQRKGFVTSNASFCPLTGGKMELFDKIKAKYDAQKTAVWAHIWYLPDDFPDNRQGILFIAAKNPDRNTLCSGSVDLAGALQEGFNTTEHSYGSRFTQIANVLLFTAAASCTGELGVIDYARQDLTQAAAGDACPFGILDDASFFMSPGNQPVQLAKGTIPYFAQASAQIDNRSLFAFLDGNKRFEGCKFGGTNTFAGYYRIQETSLRYAAQAGNEPSYKVYLGKYDDDKRGVKISLHRYVRNQPTTLYAEGEMRVPLSGIVPLPPTESGETVFNLTTSPIEDMAFEKAFNNALYRGDGKGTVVSVIDNTVTGSKAYFMCLYSDARNANVWYRLKCHSAGAWVEVNMTSQLYSPFLYVHGMMIELRKDAFKDWLVFRRHELLDIGGLIPLIGAGFDALNGVFYLQEGEKGAATLCFIGAGLSLVDFASAGDIIIANIKISTKGGWSAIHKAAIDLYAIRDAARVFKMSDDGVKSMFSQLHAIGDGGKLLAEFTANTNLVRAWNYFDKAGLGNVKNNLDLLKKLADDTVANSKLVSALDANPQLVEFWKLIDDIGDASLTAYRSDPDILKRLAGDIAQNSGLKTFIQEKGTSGFLAWKYADDAFPDRIWCIR